MSAETPLQQKGNAMLWGVLGLLGAFVVGYFYVLPSVRELKTTRLAASALAADAQSLQTTINLVTATDQSLGEHQAAIDRLALAVPDHPAFDELLVSLSAIASASGVVVPTMQPLTAASGESGAGVSLTVRGSYSGIHLFLELVSQNLRPLKVTQLTLSSTSDVTGASLISASLSLVAARVGGATAAAKGTGTTGTGPDSSSSGSASTGAPK